MTDRTADDPQLKVTDRRMFTSDGELREEYKELADAAASKPASPPAGTQPGPDKESENAAAQRSQQTAAPTGRPAGQQPSGARDETTPTQADYPSGAQFEDLVALLAQTTVTFLQQAARPQGRTESLEQAQLYLDLLGILDDKTAGNLAPGETAMLQDALRQLRLAFAQRG